MFKNIVGQNVTQIKCQAILRARCDVIIDKRGTVVNPFHSISQKYKISDVWASFPSIFLKSGADGTQLLQKTALYQSF